MVFGLMYSIIVKVNRMMRGRRAKVNSYYNRRRPVMGYINRLVCRLVK
jgi:hypothetical protein